MLDIRKLKELVKLMVDNDLSEMDLRDEGETVSLKRATAAAAPIVTHGVVGGQPVVVAAPAPVTAAPVAAAPTAAAAPAAPAKATLPAIESPMVGTFYAAAGPGKAPFVTAGQKVTPTTTVCLIEAMKIFNEIKAERAGTIVEVLVETGNAVEFGQKLFTIQPD